MAKAPLDRPLQLRVTAELYSLFEAAAARDGRTLSNWARERLTKAARAELGDQAAAIPSPADYRASPPAPPEPRRKPTKRATGRGS